MKKENYRVWAPFHSIELNVLLELKMQGLVLGHVGFLLVLKWCPWAWDSVSQLGAAVLIWAQHLEFPIMEGKMTVAAPGSKS